MFWLTQKSTCQKTLRVPWVSSTSLLLSPFLLSSFSAIRCLVVLAMIDFWFTGISYFYLPFVSDRSNETACQTPIVFWIQCGPSRAGVPQTDICTNAMCVCEAGHLCDLRDNTPINLTRKYFLHPCRWHCHWNWNWLWHRYCRLSHVRVLWGISSWVIQSDWLVVIECVCQLREKLESDNYSSW